MVQIPKTMFNIVALVSFASAGAANADTTFSGLYAGGGLGLQAADADWTTTATYDPSGAPIPASSPIKESLSDSSAIFSVFLGYNFMLNDQWLFGTELGYAAGDFEDDIPDRIPGLGFGSSGSYSEVEAGGESSLAARAGYLLNDDLMVYGALSIRTMDVEASSTCPADTNVCNPSFGTQTFSEDDRLQGWGLGIGVEKSFGDNVMLRGEYRYADYGDFEFTAFPYDPASRYGAAAKIDVKSDTFEVGVAYLF